MANANSTTLSSGDALTAENWNAGGAYGAVPIGTIVPWLKTIAGTPSLPSGWNEADGTTISDSNSPVDGETIPDLNGDNRFLRGNSTSGGTGGSATHQLSVAELPSHAHGIPIWETGGIGDSRSQGAVEDGNSDEHNSSATGNNTAHANEPQYYNVVWIYRYL